MCWLALNPCPLGFPALVGSKSNYSLQQSTANAKQILWLSLKRQENKLPKDGGLKATSLQQFTELKGNIPPFSLKARGSLYHGRWVVGTQ